MSYAYERRLRLLAFSVAGVAMNVACGGLPYVGGLPFEEGQGDAGDVDTGIRGVAQHDAGGAVDEAAAAEASDPPPPHDAGGEPEASPTPPVDAAGDEPTAPACAASFSRGSCAGYALGAEVSKDGRNWACAAVACANCATSSQCDPGAAGCPWGHVWTDEGPCQ